MADPTTPVCSAPATTEACLKRYCTAILYYVPRQWKDVVSESPTLALYQVGTTNRRDVNTAWTVSVLHFIEQALGQLKKTRIDEYSMLFAVLTSFLTILYCKRKN